ncbi:thymic stromal cotransporter homolog [Scomber scombrus]|uniref:Thymic stromal cotransporter homolog n=2 Tax=Scomber scombrus TaxID=13677 RepID=A0AAV1N5D6_SCOSC
MVMTGVCQTIFAVLRLIEPTVVLEELASALFDTALLLVVKDRSANGTDPHISREESQQKAITNFYLTFNLIIQLTPILPSMLLAWLGDRGWRKAPIVVPLCGYLLSRIMLLLVVLFRLPLEVMYGAATVFGLSGGYCAYWSGVMTLASLASTTADRSKVIMRVELLYGAAGLVGSLVSGHLFSLYSANVGHGTILLCVAIALLLLSLLHSSVLLKVKDVSKEPDEDGHILSPTNGNVATQAPAGKNMVNMVLLFAAAIMYTSAVGGAMEVLGSFVLKAPLNWNAKQVGYGNAAGAAVFFTSFVGVIVFRRCVSDAALIMIGMVSFASGIYFMTFVTATYMYYLARLLTLFALIPMPTIRSLLSQQVPASSYGITLTSLQLSLKFAGLVYLPVFTKIYQATLNRLPGCVFMLSSILSVLGMIPISIVGCRSPQRQHYQRIQGD